MARRLRAARRRSRAARGPYFVVYDQPSSPLEHPADSVDKLLFCADKGVPVVYSPAPLAGGTAPITVAGHVAQGMAESLFGLVLHQLRAPGAPFLIGEGPAVLDMATAQSSYNAPEYLHAYACAVEMAKWLDIPNFGYGGTTDSQVVDAQAGLEVGECVTLSLLLGSNLNHDVGYLDFGLTGSLRADRHRRRVHRHEPASVRRRRDLPRHPCARRDRGGRARAATSSPSATPPGGCAAPNGGRRSSTARATSAGRTPARRTCGRRRACGRSSCCAPTHGAPGRRPHEALDALVDGFDREAETVDEATGAPWQAPSARQTSSSPGSTASTTKPTPGWSSRLPA